MTNEEVMQLMTDMGLHEGGIENWLMDNAWVLVVNKAIEKEREACAKLIAKLTEMLEIQQKLHETAIDMLKPAIEAEREACAKLCETISNTQANMNAAWRNGCRDAATEIRAMGENK